MKKVLLLLVLVFTSSIYFNTKAQTDSVIKVKTIREDIKIGEKIFIERADKCLDIIEQAALKISVKGVAVIAFIPGDVTMSWISKMKVVGALTNGNANFLAVANSKAAELANEGLDW